MLCQDDLCGVRAPRRKLAVQPGEAAIGRACTVAQAVKQLRRHRVGDSTVALPAFGVLIVPQDVIGKAICFGPFVAGLGNAVRHPAKVFEQHIAQHGGQGPKFADLQVPDRLEPFNKRGE